ncbi:hypothetical protein WICPIJ_008098 [Wickerhamomyces pijperi]|uniref:Uncharacterized protein n=1 Tax=Wickerhamomyces pijperi TaxID=599730 RepID=A0A9P8PYT7_WICPI|nr:hypothetical protein WICPIJ_008098 [Wickerhamomyces pijperi]
MNTPNLIGFICLNRAQIQIHTSIYVTAHDMTTVNPTSTPTTQPKDYLKTISFTIPTPSPSILNNHSSIEDLELWGQQKSFTYKQYISGQRKPLQFFGIVNVSFTPLWSIISEPFEVYTNNEDTLNSLTDLMRHSKLLLNESLTSQTDMASSSGLFQNGILLRSNPDLFMLIFFERSKTGINSVFATLLNFNFSKMLYYVNNEIETEALKAEDFPFKDEHDQELQEDQASGYFIDGVALKRTTPITTTSASASRAPSLSRSASSLNISQIPSSDIFQNQSQRSSPSPGPSSVSANSSSQLSAQEQLRILTNKEAFQTIIKSEVAFYMKTNTKQEQNDVSDICFRSLNFKFQSLPEVNVETEIDIRKWLRVLLECLGVKKAN